MARSKDDPAMQYALREVLQEILGDQANIGLRRSGTISLTPKVEYQVLVIPHDDKILVRANHYLRIRPPSPTICELCDPQFTELRAALKALGFVDCWDTEARPN